MIQSPKPPKSYRDSLTTMTEYVLPVHANAMGNVFGGQILAWMDICAAMCSQRHCGTIAVTAGIDDLAFEQPIKVGQIVKLEGRVTAAFKSSVEVQVIVTGEDGATGTTWSCVSAYLTFVAIGPVGAPVHVPGLLCESDEEKQLSNDAEARRKHRLDRRSR